MTPKRFKRGEHVSWNSEAGRVRGKITRVVTAPTEFKGYMVHASRDEPDQERDHGPSRDAQGRGAHEAPRRSPNALTHLVCVLNRNGVPSNGRGHYQECKAMNILDHLVVVSGDSRSGEFKRETSSPYGMGPPGIWARAVGARGRFRSGSKRVASVRLSPENARRRSLSRRADSACSRTTQRRSSRSSATAYASLSASRTSSLRMPTIGFTCRPRQPGPGTSSTSMASRTSPSRMILL